MENNSGKIEVLKYMKKCWKCSKDTPIVTYDIVGDYNYNIGDQQKLDLQLLEKYPFVQKRFSKTMGMEVICNVCQHCDQIQGNFFVRDDIIDMAYITDEERNALIDSYIDDNLRDEDMYPETKKSET